MNQGPMPGGPGQPGMRAMSQQEAQALQEAQRLKMMKMLENGRPVLCKGKDEKGDVCACQVFKEGIQMVKVSGMDPNNDTGQDQMAHVPVLYCIKCLTPVDIK